MGRQRPHRTPPGLPILGKVRKTIDQQVFKLWHYNEEYQYGQIFTATVLQMPEVNSIFITPSPVPFEANRLREAPYPDSPAEQDGVRSTATTTSWSLTRSNEGSALQCSRQQPNGEFQFGAQRPCTEKSTPVEQIRRRH